MVLSDDSRFALLSELVYTASRSGGPGGQNVNKVNTQVELRFSISESIVFNEFQKELIFNRLKNRINSKNELILVSRSERTQWRNKTLVTEKFFQLIENALTPVKKRVRTKPTRISKLKRMEGKKIKAQKKQLRKPPDW